MTRDDPKFKESRHFKHASKEQFKEYAQKSAYSRRSPQLRHAWDDQETIQELYNSGIPAQQIAKQYDISVRSAYRIIDA